MPDPEPAVVPPVVPAVPNPAVLPSTDPPEPDSKAWSKVNREAAAHRHRANEAEQRAAALEAERNSAAAERDTANAARVAAEAEAATLRAASKSVATKASLKVAAIRAGIVDLDALRLVDTAGLETDDSGELKDGVAVMEKLKAEKPYLFGSNVAPKLPTTTNPQTPPAPKAPSKKPALDMTDAEFDAARREKSWRT